MQYFISNINAFEDIGILNKTESQHCIRVLRHKPGDKILVTNGDGLLLEATILTADPGKCSFHVVRQLESPKQHPYYLHIAIAPTKNTDRLEWFVEKSVEIGINEISFVSCRFSERRAVNIERMLKIAESAMKQSLKTRLPVINGIVPFTDFISKRSIGLKCIAHCMGDKKVHLTESLNSGHNHITVIIGPEGDFSVEEVEAAIKQNYYPVSLGENRLRT